MKIIRSISLALPILAVLMFQSISAEAEIFYTYYPSGRLQSVTLTPPDGPDRYGNVYYYYIDEDWGGQGYGRVGKIARESDPDGELSYILSYYDNIYGRLWVKRAYADINWRILAATYTYYDNTAGLLQAKTIAGADPSGDIKYEYINENYQGRGYGKLSRTIYPDGSYEAILEYWGNSEIVRLRERYDAAGNLTERFEYLGNGVYRNMLKETLGYHSYTYSDGVLVMETTPSGEIMVFNYSEGIFTGYTRIYDTAPGIRIKEEYDSSRRLVKKYEMERPFFSGVNLPWFDYGKDIGISGFDNKAHGFSSKREELDRRMREMAGGVARVFLFTDLRSGIKIDANGDIIGFDDQSALDLRSLLDAAEAGGVSLILTLFDYLIADGQSRVTYWNGYTWVTEPLGEYPQFITDAAKRAQLAGAVKDLFNRVGLNNYRRVLGFDVMNEPEWAHDWGGVSYTNLRSFVYDFRDMLHANFAGKSVTVGSKDRDALLANWGAGLDLYQFHHYNWMNDSGLNIDYPAINLDLDQGVFAGELEPNGFTYKLMTLYNNGYEGGLFWQDTNSYFIARSDLRVFLNWFVGTTYGYYASGKLMSRDLPRADADNNIRYEYLDEDFQGRAYGRLSKIVKADGSYEVFVEYWRDTEKVKTKELYDSNGQLIGRYQYDENGNPILQSPVVVDSGYLESRQWSVDNRQPDIYGQMVIQTMGYLPSWSSEN